jgi:hypothetical protein
MKVKLLDALLDRLSGRESFSLDRLVGRGEKKKTSEATRT